jgi:signal transduction histidine kinase
MPDLSPQATHVYPRSRGRRGKSSTLDLATERGLRSRFRSNLAISTLPALVGIAAAWLVSHEAPAGRMPWTLAALAAVVCAGIMLLADRRGATLARTVHQQRVDNATAARQWVERFDAVAAEGRKNIAQLLEQVSRGERLQLPDMATDSASPGNSFAVFERTLRLGQHEALQAISQAAARQQVDVFVNIAQRLHALVNRALARLDALEREVEDPDLLGGLFGVDHLVTQFRRQVESLAVMGGAVPRRINKPVPLPTVLRQGVAEIEQYARVRVIQPPDGTLPGFAAAEIIHLLAELVENAARFSAPETQVTLRAERVPAGLAIEIDDRGLPMPPDKLHLMNQLLTRPDQFNIREQLEDGRIGLFVVAQIARRHNIEVALRRNIYGGNQAVVVLPAALLSVGQESAQRPVADPRDPSSNSGVAISHPSPAPHGDSRSSSAGASAEGSERSGPSGEQGDELSVRRIDSPPPVAAGVAFEKRLPRRRKNDTQNSALHTADITPAGGGRPALPKRSETHLGLELPESDMARDRQVVAPNPDLMARFASGIRLASAEDSTAERPDHPS